MQYTNSLSGIFLWSAYSVLEACTVVRITTTTTSARKIKLHHGEKSENQLHHRDFKLHHRAINLTFNRSDAIKIIL